MFTTLVAFVFALPLLALAVPTPDAPQCNTGTLQCCQSFQARLLTSPSTSSSSAESSSWDDLLDVVTQGTALPIGVGCTPINVIGAGGGSNCNTQPVCCQNTGGAFAINCAPIAAPL
ncbi:fungal hydrophobin [Rickenella mellea]|uniref:Hydrophobin n=1 Tax=Rickenella mellea TaxID=50990 RepID=A0A4Y7PZC0_9AGAM|nr:fungal hydrophobin [Rickenella mellea]